MRRYLWASVTAIVLLLLLRYPYAYASQPCVDRDHGLARADVVVLGEIVWKPFPRIYVVRAERYYRGTGKQYFLAEEEDRVFARGDWKTLVKNTPAVLGFRQESWGTTWGFCKFWESPDSPLINPMKPGVSPEPGIDLNLRLFWIDIAMSAALLVTSVLALRGLVRWAIRKRAARD